MLSDLLGQRHQKLSNLTLQETVEETGVAREHLR